MKKLWRIFRWPLYGLLAAFAVILAVGLWRYWTRPAPEKPVPEIPDAIVYHTDCIVHSLDAGGDSLEAWPIDARGLSVAAFRSQLVEIGHDDALLWAVGEHDWLVTWRKDGGKVSLAAMMDAFLSFDEEGERDGGVGCVSVADLFASYVGTVAEISGAFAALKPTDKVAPEMFVTREIPALSWLDTAEVEPDIAKDVLTDYRRMQSARRQLLNGTLRSYAGDGDAALELWAKAAKLNRYDPMLQERLFHLRKNAEVFLKIGKYGMASSCFETYVCICPDDYPATVNLATCLDKLGKREMAAELYRRAETLRARFTAPGE